MKTTLSEKISSTTQLLPGKGRIPFTTVVSKTFPLLSMINLALSVSVLILSRFKLSRFSKNFTPPGRFTCFAPAPSDN